MDTAAGLALLAEAAEANGLVVERVESIRNGSHLMYRVNDDLVARIGEIGTAGRALYETKVSRWLAGHGISVVEAAEGLMQPTVVAYHPVTWWRMLGRHRHATPSELGSVLKRLHQVPAPDDPWLARFAPFENAAARLSRVNLGTEDTEWLGSRIQTLGEMLERLISNSSSVTVIHGDAWQGNVATTQTGEQILMDLESVCIGPAEWDLVPLAADYVDFSRISTEEYNSFVESYGSDALHSPNFRLLADIQELRWLLFVAGKTVDDPAAAREAAHRIACIKGEISRPWSWTAF